MRVNPVQEGRDGREREWLTFYIIHMTTDHLLAILNNPTLCLRENRDSLLQHIIEKCRLLGQMLYTLPITPSIEAWSKSIYASLAFQRYLWDRDEGSRIEAKDHLHKIRELLSLNELFKRHSNEAVDLKHEQNTPPPGQVSFEGAVVGAGLR